MGANDGGSVGVTGRESRFGTEEINQLAILIFCKFVFILFFSSRDFFFRLRDNCGGGSFPASSVLLAREAATWRKR